MIKRGHILPEGYAANRGKMLNFFISLRSLEIELIEYRTALSGSDV